MRRPQTKYLLDPGTYWTLSHKHSPSKNYIIYQPITLITPVHVQLQTSHAVVQQQAAGPRAYRLNTMQGSRQLLLSLSTSSSTFVHPLNSPTGSVVVC